MFILSGILVSSVLLSALLHLITKRIDPLRDFWRVVAAIILTDFCCAIVFLLLGVLLLDWIGKFGVFVGALIAFAACHYFVLGWLFDLVAKQRVVVTALLIFVQILWSLISGIALY